MLQITLVTKVLWPCFLICRFENFGTFIEFQLFGSKLYKKKYLQNGLFCLSSFGMYFLCKKIAVQTFFGGSIIIHPFYGIKHTSNTLYYMLYSLKKPSAFLCKNIFTLKQTVCIHRNSPESKSKKSLEFFKIKLRLHEIWIIPVFLL